jgi:hypothetical protein
MTSAHLLEGLIQTWLQKSPLGSGIMRDAHMSLDDATNAVFELLNAGYMKIRADEHRFLIEPCMPPRPPLKRLSRPARIAP